jgi:hypothetical protein
MSANKNRYLLKRNAQGYFSIIILSVLNIFYNGYSVDVFVECQFEDSLFEKQARDMSILITGSFFLLTIIVLLGFLVSSIYNVII